MVLFFQIVFFLSAYAIFHTYIVYPVFLAIFSKKKHMNNIQFQIDDHLPEIVVICAAYNEETVIAQKIESTFNTSYPMEKVSFYIGTDACTDHTTSIIKKYQKKYPALKHVEFTERTGKINIINNLCAIANSPVLVMTDANVLFKEGTFFELAKHFKDVEVKMVCGNIIKRALNTEAVTKSELQYLNFENFLKHAESRLWNIVIGAEGGCYALRKENYSPVPSHFIADDFFITCEVLSATGKILFEKKAVVYEDTISDTEGEFKRKTRIATGNFQNLIYFRKLLNPFSKTGFAFLSHKVLRWLTPFFFLLNTMCCLYLFYNYHIVFKYIFFMELLLLIIPLLNYLLIKMRIRLKLLLSASHFIVMNMALFVGFFRYCGGVTSSIWQPVRR